MKTQTYYPIDKEMARRAQDANSFYDYHLGSATAQYRASVDEAFRLRKSRNGT